MLSDSDDRRRLPTSIYRGGDTTIDLKAERTKGDFFRMVIDTSRALPRYGDQSCFRERAAIEKKLLSRGEQEDSRDSFERKAVFYPFHSVLISSTPNCELAYIDASLSKHSSMNFNRSFILPKFEQSRHQKLKVSIFYSFLRSSGVIPKAHPLNKVDKHNHVACIQIPKTQNSLPP